MCKKSGKLPPPSTYGYNTEYSKDVLELKEGSGEVVIVDDTTVGRYKLSTDWLKMVIMWLVTLF